MSKKSQAERPIIALLQGWRRGYGGNRTTSYVEKWLKMYDK